MSLAADLLCSERDECAGSAASATSERVVSVAVVQSAHSLCAVCDAAPCLPLRRCLPLLLLLGCGGVRVGRLRVAAESGTGSKDERDTQGRTAEACGRGMRTHSEASMVSAPCCRIGRVECLSLEPQRRSV